MSIAAGMVAEIEHGSVSTRKHLERLPENKYDYKPHAKSMSAGQLASHLCEIWKWGVVTVAKEEFEFDLKNYKPWVAANRKELLEAHDAQLAEFKGHLAATTDAAMMQTWRMTNQGEVMFEMPRIAVLRSMILNHLVHHRAQLGVYLRLLDVSVPSAFGPSADEKA